MHVGKEIKRVSCSTERSGERLRKEGVKGTVSECRGKVQLDHKLGTL